MAITYGISKRIGDEAIHAFVESLWARWPVALIAIKALTVIFAPLSWTAIYLIGGGLYGTQIAFLYLSLGNFIGHSVAFAVGRIRGKKAVVRICGKKSGRKIIMLLEHLSSRKKFLIARMTLLPLEDLISYAAWLSRLKYWVYILLSMVVMTWYSLVFILLGDYTVL